MTAVNLSLIRGTPLMLSGPAHVIYDGRQLCRQPVHQPTSWDRSDITEGKDVCATCTSYLLNLLGIPVTATEATVLQIVRGDYDARTPNRFWREHGVTHWSRV